MTRIYFDSNVYSNLRRAELPQFQQLRALIDRYRHNLSFFFSPAHIRDKRRDISEKKFDDFAFMESLTGDNHLSYHGLEKNPSFYLATPLMVFQDDNQEEENPFCLLSVFDPADDDIPAVSALKSLAKSQFYQVKVPFDTSLLQQVPEEQKEVLSKLIPLDRPDLTVGEFMENFLGFLQELNTDHNTYKELRSLVDTGINNGKITMQNSQVNFNEALKDSAIQKTFIDFVKDSLSPNHKEGIPYYDFYLLSYNSLDLLGISKDKINVKNTYKNLFNDSLHSYYARYCDYLVTDDKDLSRKSKALYDLYEVGTRVVTVQEFIDLLPEIGKDTETNILHFIAKLHKDLQEAPRSETVDTEFGFNRLVRISQPYLNTFDGLMEIQEENQWYYYLFTLRGHLLSSPNYRETGMIISKCLDLLGSDLEGKGAFNFEEEVEQIRNDTWKGRTWRIGPLSAYIHHEKGLGSLSLFIGPIANTREELDTQTI